MKQRWFKVRFKKPPSKRFLEPPHARQIAIPRIRLEAELDRAQQEITLLRKEVRIKDVRMAILQLKAARV